ncbi:hypothetical protein MNBD_GAMMA09-540 [hydrothermal vent metagenome]|uniref:Thymidine phosphorylase n=1 Tax=hydrothermal vent metagenome TaxID=652676 RepID=A0A3B0XGE1_9ZZZZ
MSASIHKLNSPSQVSNNQYKLLIKQITGCLNEELSVLVGRMFDGADDMLFQLAENADSNEDQNQYFDTMRMLRVERKNIGQNFAANLKTYLQPPNNDSEQANPLLDDELSLVDQDEMEELVAISTMHSKAMNLYGEAVNHLEARVEFLSMKSTTIFDKNALAPKNICESFKDTLIEIELSTNNKLVLYKLFDQEVIMHLAPLYTKLNQLFIDQGILPQIKLGESFAREHSQPQPQQPQGPAATQQETNDNDALYTQNSVYDPRQTATFHNSQHYNSNSPSGGEHNNLQGNGQQGSTGYGGQYGGGQAPQQPSGTPGTGSQSSAYGNGTYASGSPNTMQQQVEHVVSQFISGELTASGPGIPASFTTASSQPASPGTQYYDRRDVMKALSSLQYNVAQSSSPIEQVNAADFKRALLADMGSRSGGAITKQVNQVDEKTIDFIEMLFDAIVDDSSISEAVTNLLLRLQIPVIKVAMLDKDFFVDGEHPCRTTLNLIAHLGRGLISRDDDLFNKLNQVVENLLNDFDVDITSFENAATHLENIEQNELLQSVEKERHTQKSVLQTHAREVVLAELQYQVMNKTLPKMAQKLLLKHWSTLMFHYYIKLGKSSDEWQESVNTVTQLVRLLQPVQSSQAHHFLTSEKDQLLDTIHKTLLQTRQNPVEIETEINNIFLIFNEMIENSAFSPAALAKEESYFVSVDETADDSDIMTPDELDAPAIDFPEAEINPLQEQAEKAREKIAKLPASVRPGVWFKVHNGDSNVARRAKLSVIIMEEAKLIFVDRIGVKVIEKDADVFNAELDSESSQVISDHSAFDHALGLVITSLSTAT